MVLFMKVWGYLALVGQGGQPLAVPKRHMLMRTLEMATKDEAVAEAIRVQQANGQQGTTVRNHIGQHSSAPNWLT